MLVLLAKFKQHWADVMEEVSNDFIFGTLATDQQRLAFFRAEMSGVAHRNHIQPLDPLPGQEVCITVTIGPQVVADNVTCYFTTDGTVPAGRLGVPAPGSRSVALNRVASVWNIFLWGYLEEWQCQLPPLLEHTTVRYCIEAWSSLTGQSAWASEIIGIIADDGKRLEDAGPDYNYLHDIGAEFGLTFIQHARTFAYQVDRERAPEWLRDALIYHVFVDRFNPGSGRSFVPANDPMAFHGGTIRGVIEKLDYIASLGTTVIWLSPIFPSPSHHGYDTTDYQGVEPRMGTMEDVRALIDAVHARDMRVLFDYTANHCSSAHPIFQDVLQNPNSPYRNWFTFLRYPDLYLSFFGVKDLPQINNDYPDARQAMIDYALYWLEQGVDGFRLDYAIGPSRAFWTEFRTATRTIKSDSVLLGEAVDTADEMRSYMGRLDGCLDFLLLQAVRLFFAFGSITPSQFDAFVRRHLTAFPPGFVLPSFLDNHDMNRFAWVVRGDMRRLKLAALCQFTLPHPPIIYYGTEVGMSQVRDVRHADGSGHPEESRLPMIWGEEQNLALLDFYRQLGQLRSRTASVWRGPRRTLYLDDARSLYAFACADERAPHTALYLVAFNNSPETHAIPLPVGQRWELILASETAHLVDGQLTLSAYGGAVLRTGP